MQTNDSNKCIQLDREFVCPGIVFVLPQDRKCSFPYSAYMWSEGTETEVTIHFHTHRVVIRGQHLEQVPDYLASQQVRWVKTAGRATGLLSNALNSSAPFVDEITVEKTGES
jgi:hypothetical protein